MKWFMRLLTLGVILAGVIGVIRGVRTSFESGQLARFLDRPEAERDLCYLHAHVVSDMGENPQGLHHEVDGHIPVVSLNQSPTVRVPGPAYIFDIEASHTFRDVHVVRWWYDEVAGTCLIQLLTKDLGSGDVIPLYQGEDNMRRIIGLISSRGGMFQKDLLNPFFSSYLSVAVVKWKGHWQQVEALKKARFALETPDGKYLDLSRAINPYEIDTGYPERHTFAQLMSWHVAKKGAEIGEAQADRAFFTSVFACLFLLGLLGYSHLRLGGLDMPAGIRASCHALWHWPHQPEEEIQPHQPSEEAPRISSVRTPDMVIRQARGEFGSWLGDELQRRFADEAYLVAQACQLIVFLEQPEVRNHLLWAKSTRDEDVLQNMRRLALEQDLQLMVMYRREHHHQRQLDRFTRQAKQYGLDCVELMNPLLECDDLLGAQRLLEQFEEYERQKKTIDAMTARVRTLRMALIRDSKDPDVLIKKLEGLRRAKPRDFRRGTHLIQGILVGVEAKSLHQIV